MVCQKWCIVQQKVSIEKVTRPERPVLDAPGYSPMEVSVLIGVPEELREFFDVYTEGYSETEFAKELIDVILQIEIENIEINTIVEDMDAELNENNYFYDIYFCYEEQLPEIKSLGGCVYFVDTEYMDKSGKNLYIGLLPQSSLVEQEIKKDIINYFRDRMEQDFGSHFPEEE